MRAAVVAAVALVAAAAGYVAGRGRAPASGEAPRTVVVERGGTREIVTRPAELGPDQLRAIIRDELAHQSAATPAVAGDEAAAASDDTAVTRARAIVDRALARGVWTDDDRAGFRAVAAGLKKEHVDELFGRIFPALNDGRLRAAFTGVPL